jgi:hypothetical protein
MMRTDALLRSINDRLGVLTEGVGGSDIEPLGLRFVDDLMGFAERESAQIEKIIKDQKHAHKN